MVSQGSQGFDGRQLFAQTRPVFHRLRKEVDRFIGAVRRVTRKKDSEIEMPFRIARLKLGGEPKFLLRLIDAVRGGKGAPEQAPRGNPSRGIAKARAKSLGCTLHIAALECFDTLFPRAGNTAATRGKEGHRSP